MSAKSTISIYKTDIPDFNELCKGMKSADFIRELIIPGMVSVYCSDCKDYSKFEIKTLL